MLIYTYMYREPRRAAGGNPFTAIMLRRCEQKGFLADAGRGTGTVAVAIAPVPSATAHNTEIAMHERSMRPALQSKAVRRSLPGRRAHHNELRRSICKP